MSNDTITINAVEFDFGDNMGTASGIIAEEVSTVYIDTGLVSDTIVLSGAQATGTYTIPDATTSWNWDSSGELDLVKTRLDKLESVLLEEKELRDQHPAVKQAYDEYRLLLVLAKQHTPEILTDQ